MKELIKLNRNPLNRHSSKRRSAVRNILVVAACASVLGACGSDDAPTSTEPVIAPDDSTQMANPASVFCEQQGGTVEIVDEANGQVGYCNLPDGTRIEEWEYYRAENPDAASEGEPEMPGDGVG